MTISKRLRFEVLRRDNFTCRYCGLTAPDVHLRVDHVTPAVLGGPDDPTNLVTACEPCNSGKSSTTMDAPLVAEVEQKALLWARALEVAVQNRETELGNMRDLLDAFEGAWQERWDPAAPIGVGWQETVKRFVAYGLTYADLEDSVDIAYQAHLRQVDRWRYFCGICWNKAKGLRESAQALIDAGAVHHGA